MNTCIDFMRPRRTRGFTLVELLVVIAIIILLVSILVPALGKALRAAHSIEDKNHAKGIHEAMLVYSTSNEGELPRPSVVSNQDNPDVTLDTTGNLMSMLIGQHFFNTDLVISPVETNPNIVDINENGLMYDFNSIDGEQVFWDPAFQGDIEAATAAAPANNSYAHLALCGQRVRLKWHAGASSSDIIISNRGPEDGLSGADYSSDSNTLKFHGEDSVWKGVIVAGDGSARIVDTYFPEGIAYQPLNGEPLGDDNLFNADWDDITIPSVPLGMPSGDNWMVICNEVLSENEITAVWD